MEGGCYHFEIETTAELSSFHVTNHCEPGIQIMISIGRFGDYLIQSLMNLVTEPR